MTREPSKFLAEFHWYGCVKSIWTAEIVSTVMSDYSIPWKLLRDWEADFFTSRGVGLEKSGVTFSRRLSRDDLRDVLALLLSMRRRTEESAENHINFAIGDCANKATEWFGKDITDQLCKEVIDWFPKRDVLLLFAASVLIYIQRVEILIKFCCSVLDVGLSVDDLLSNNKKCQQATMGYLRAELEKRKLFSPDYEKELKDFVADRNCFIHSLWTVELPKMLADDTAIDSAAVCGRFITTLLHRAEKCERTFKGLVASLGVGLPDNSSAGFSESTLWVRYTGDFEEARRKV